MIIYILAIRIQSLIRVDCFIEYFYIINQCISCSPILRIISHMNMKCGGRKSQTTIGPCRFVL